MNIAVIQPQGHGSGTTTIAALLASELGSRNAQVCLAATKPVSDALYQYYNVQEEKAKQNVGTELVSLIKFGGIKKEKVRDYCRNVEENLDLFVLNTPYQKGILEEDDMVQTLEFLGTNSPYDYVVYDVDEKHLERQTVKTILSVADACILVLTQDACDVKSFMKQKQAFIKDTRGIPTVVVVNRYSTLLGDIKGLAQSMGVKNTKNWCTVHDNIYVRYCGNRGEYPVLSKKIRENAADVVELNHDVSVITQNIMEIKKIDRKRRIESQRSARKQ